MTFSDKASSCNRNMGKLFFCKTSYNLNMVRVKNTDNILQILLHTEIR